MGLGGIFSQNHVIVSNNNSTVWTVITTAKLNIVNFNLVLRWSCIDIPSVQIAMIWVNVIIHLVWADIKAPRGCKESSSSYQYNSIKFDSK